MEQGEREIFVASVNLLNLYAIYNLLRTALTCWNYISNLIQQVLAEQNLFLFERNGVPSSRLHFVQLLQKIRPRRRVWICAKPVMTILA